MDAAARWEAAAARWEGAAARLEGPPGRCEGARCEGLALPFALPLAARPPVLLARRSDGALAAPAPAAPPPLPRLAAARSAASAAAASAVAASTAANPAAASAASSSDESESVSDQWPDPTGGPPGSGPPRLGAMLERDMSRACGGRGMRVRDNCASAWAARRAASTVSASASAFSTIRGKWSRHESMSVASICSALEPGRAWREGWQLQSETHL